MNKLYLTFALAFILSLALVSSATFDNVKSFEKGDLKYGKVTITNAFGMGAILEEITLWDNSETCGDNCYFETEIKLNQRGTLIENIRYLRLMPDGSWKESNIKSYKILIQTDEKEYQEDVYEWRCVETGKISINGTKEKSCSNIKTGTITKKEPIWREYVLGEVVDKGVYKVRGEGSKRADWTYDWQITSQGKLIDEWAVWGAYEGRDLLSYWTLNETSGIRYDSLGKYNITNEIPSIAGLIGNGVNMNGTQLNTTKSLSGINGEFSVSFWWKSDSDSCNPATYACDSLFVTYTNIGLQIVDGSCAGTAGGIRFYFNGQGCKDVGKDLTDGNWHNIIFTALSNDVQKIYIDGVYNTSNASGTFTNINQDVIIASHSASNGGTVNIMDEVGIWDRVLSESEVTWLYNSGSGRTYKDLGNSYLVLNSPVSYYNSSTSANDFNFTATLVEATFVNASLFTNMTGSWTIADTTTTNGELLSTNFSSDGNYLWAVQACDSDGDCGFSENRTIRVDATAPTISITYPSGTIAGLVAGQNITLNYSVSDTNLQSCWYQYNNLNSTNYSCLNKTFTYVSGVNTIKVWANDSVGNLGSATSNFDYLVLLNNVIFNSATTSTSNENYTLNISFVPEISNVEADFWFNTTKITTSKTVISSTNLRFDNTYTIPGYISATVIPIKWAMTLTHNNGSVIYLNSSTYNQTVNPLQSINISSDCLPGYSTAIFFDFKEEQNLTKLSGLSVNYNFLYGAGNSTALSTYGTLSSVSNVSVCVNSSITEYFIGYGQIQYSLSNYNTRNYYVFTGTRITNQTVNITAYSVASNQANSFQITAQDNQVNLLKNYYLSLLRWYPELNDYKIVEIGKTDDRGQTVVSIRPNDVTYRIGVYTLSGTLKKLLDPQIFVCSSTPCTYSLYADLGANDYTSWAGVQSNLTYNNNTKIVTYIWNDPSQKTSAMNLTVYKHTGYGTTVICSTSATGYTGVLACSIGNNTGTLEARAYRSASPSTIFASIMIDLRDTFSEITGSKGIALLIALLLVILLSLIGVFNPVAALILGIIGLVPAVILGGLPWMFLVGIGVIGGIIVHILRRT